jgi:colanic acid biosynthesis glycosyl transferase WcaI
MDLAADGRSPRILILGVDYAPDMAGIAPYTTGLAEYLASLGLDVRVVTTFPHYPLYQWSSAAPIAGVVEQRNGVIVDRRWVILPRSNTTGWRILFDTSFGLVALGAAMFAKCDVLISVCVPIQAGLAGGLIARVRGLPSLLWVQDLPVAAAVSTGLLRRDGLGARIGRLVEAAAMRLNTRVVVINERFASYAAELGIPSDSLSVLPDWANDPIDPSVVVAPHGERNDHFLVVHVGNIGHKQGLDVLPSLSKRLGPRFHLLLIGDGSRRKQIEAECRRVGADNVTFTGLQTPEDLASALGSADALLLSQSREVVDSVVPSKLLTYMAASRPIVAAVNPASVAAEIVTKAGCGVVVAAEDASGIASGLEELASRGREDLQSMGKRARDYVSTHHDRATILEAWETMIRRLASHDV